MQGWNVYRHIILSLLSDTQKQSPSFSEVYFLLKVLSLFEELTFGSTILARDDLLKRRGVAVKREYFESASQLSCQSLLCAEISFEPVNLLNFGSKSCYLKGVLSLLYIQEIIQRNLLRDLYASGNVEASKLIYNAFVKLLGTYY